MKKLIPALCRSDQVRWASGGRSEPAVCWPKPAYGPASRDVHRSNLMNGIKIAAARISGAQMSACTIMFQAGSRYERPDGVGCTHMIRAATCCSGAAYSSYIKSRYLQHMGGYMTCSSDRQSISYTLRCPMPVFNELKGFLVDSAARCSYASHELDVVKDKVKYDLIRMPSMERVIDLVQTACWGGPLSHSVYCNRARLGDLSSSVLNTFADIHFRTHKCTIASVGIKFEETLKLAEHMDFRAVKRHKEPMARSFPRGGYECRDMGPGVQTLIALAVPGCGTADMTVLLTHALLASACGTGNVSTGQHARDRSPQPPLGTLAEDELTNFTAFNISYSDYGTWGIVASTEAKTARDVAFQAADFFSDLDKMTSDQVDVGKRRLQTALLLEEQDSARASEALALQLANNIEYDNVGEVLRMIDNISADEVLAVAKRLSSKFRSNEMSMAVVGDVEAPPHDWELRY